MKAYREYDCDRLNRKFVGEFQTRADAEELFLGGPGVGYSANPEVDNWFFGFS